MANLNERCRKLLRVPIRVLRNWIDQDRTDGRTASATVNELRRLCEAFLEGRIGGDDVAWIFGYVDECRRAYRGGAKFAGDDRPEDVADTTIAAAIVDDEPNESALLLELTDEAVCKFATGEQHKRYRSYRKCGLKSSGTQSSTFDVSRATLHESIEKARQVGRAGVLLLAAYDADARFDALLFGDAFARTTPYTLRVFAAFEGILANHRDRLQRRTGRLATGFSRLWDRANDELRTMLSRDRSCTETVSRLIHTACFVQTLAARWGGARFRAEFEETWSILQRTGALQVPAVRQLYSSIGSYCGDCDRQLQHLETSGASRREFSGLLSFVRGVTRPGRPVLTRRFLSQPEAAIEQFARADDAGLTGKLVDVMTRYLHNPLNHNVGILRKILTWVEMWAQLVLEHELQVDATRVRRLTSSFEQYRRKLCATPGHSRVWEGAVRGLARIAG